MHVRMWWNSLSKFVESVLQQMCWLKVSFTDNYESEIGETSFTNDLGKRYVLASVYAGFHVLAKKRVIEFSQRLCCFRLLKLILGHAES